MDCECGHSVGSTQKCIFRGCGGWPQCGPSGVDSKVPFSRLWSLQGQRLIDLGYPGLAEHYFSEHRNLDHARADCDSLSTAALSTSELSADVLARIARNKKAAQDRLNAKNRLDGAKMSLSTVAPPTSELSADVLARIAGNKKAARTYSSVPRK